MKYKVFPLIMLFILNSCGVLSLKGPQKSAPKPTPTVAKTTKRKAVPLKVKPTGAKKTLAVFHLISPQSVELFLYNMDAGRTEKVLVDKTLSKLEMDAGHWQVSGFAIGESVYQSVSPTGQFLFKVKEGESTYVGSFIAECPKVGRKHLSQMKKLVFFNRFPFARDEGLCEMVIGNGHAEVNRAWVKLSKEKRVLKIGF